MPIKDYTTKISASQTVGEVQAMLAKKGARKIHIDYDDDGEAVALGFETDTPTLGRQLYSYSPNVEGVLRSMRKDVKVPNSYCTTQQARRVAWRIEKDWLEAQFAKIEAMEEPLEKLMLTYMVANDGRSLYQVMTENHMKALPE